MRLRHPVREMNTHERNAQRSHQETRGREKKHERNNLQNAIAHKNKIGKKTKPLAMTRRGANARRLRKWKRKPLQLQRPRLKHWSAFGQNAALWKKLRLLPRLAYMPKKHG